MKTFIEIGACDFNNNLELLDAGWRGIFVEPIQQYYDNLAWKVQGKNNATVVRAAITDFDGVVNMDTIPDVLSNWMRGISHISSEITDNTVSGLVKKNASKVMQVVEVPAMTMDTLLLNTDIGEIDFLQMDVEGHELVILNNYSWRIKPKYIRIEHKFVDDTILFKLLEDKGYKCWTERDDIYGILK
jgi:FkbM family methyltransferase